MFLIGAIMTDVPCFMVAVLRFWGRLLLILGRVGSCLFLFRGDRRSLPFFHQSFFQTSGGHPHLPGMAYLSCELRHNARCWQSCFTILLLGNVNPLKDYVKPIGLNTRTVPGLGIPKGGTWTPLCRVCLSMLYVKPPNVCKDSYLWILLNRTESFWVPFLFLCSSLAANMTFSWWGPLNSALPYSTLQYHTLVFSSRRVYIDTYCPKSVTTVWGNSCTYTVYICLT